MAKEYPEYVLCSHSSGLYHVLKHPENNRFKTKIKARTDDKDETYILLEGAIPIPSR